MSDYHPDQPEALSGNSRRIRSLGTEIKKQGWLRILLGTLPVVFALELLMWSYLLPTLARGKADFKQLYVAGYVVRTGAGARLYDCDYQLRLQNSLIAPTPRVLPFIRPACQALFFAPFSYLGYRASYFLWMAINIALVVATYLLLRPRTACLEALWKPLPAMLLGLFAPLSIAILQGQDSVLLVALLSAALLALERDREALAGFLVALGLFKFQIIIPIACLFVCWKRWHFVRACFVTSIALAGTSLWITGIAGMRTFFDSLGHIHYPVRYEKMANLHALLIGLFGESPAVTLVTLLASALLFAAVAKWSPAKLGPDALLIAIPTALLVGYYSFSHDWSVLIVPLLVLLDKSIERERFGWMSLFMFGAPLVSLFDLDHAYWVTVPIILFLLATARSMANTKAMQAGSY